MKPSPSIPSLMIGAGSLVLLAAPLGAAPAIAAPVVHAPATVDPSIPTPPTATDVRAKRKVMRGKAKVWWSVPNTPNPSGYYLLAQVYGSNGGGSKSVVAQPGGTRHWIVKHLPKGPTTFTVQLWYQPNLSTTQGPATTSAPSNSVKIK